MLYSKLLHLPLLRCNATVSVDAGIKPRTVATLALAQSDAVTIISECGLDVDDSG